MNNLSKFESDMTLLTKMTFIRYRLTDEPTSNIEKLQFKKEYCQPWKA